MRSVEYYELIRRKHFVDGMSLRAISKQLGHSRKFVKKAIGYPVPPGHRLADAFNQMAEDLNTSRREVMEWSQKLEDKVVEKTQELSRTQRQVLHMEKMASLGKLSATVAHELNNPIGGALTYARLVRRELEGQPLDDEVRDELTRWGLLRLASATKKSPCVFPLNCWSSREAGTPEAWETRRTEVE